MRLECEQVIVDPHDPAALGRWWREALGSVIIDDDARRNEIRLAPIACPDAVRARA